MSAILFSLLVGYLLGTIPFGLLAAQMKGVDIRQHGSGNIGATNVWRVCGWRYGLPVFVLDVVKGLVAVLASRWIAASLGGDASWTGIVAALACILGHNFPVWLGFKGGKGVATSLGVFFGLMPLPGIIVLALWGIIFKATGYVSLASIVAAVALPFVATGARYMGWECGWPAVGLAGVAALLVVLRHRANIQRLIEGTESRFAKKRS